MAQPLSGIFKSFWLYRPLILQMTKREIIGRYKGSTLGLFWSLAHPLLMLGIYTFVFSTVFRARWATDADHPGTFSVILFSGLIVFNFFAEVVQRAPTLILYNTAFVKRVAFPLECLAWISVLSALFHAVVSFVVLITLQIIFSGTVSWTLVWIPVLTIPLMLMCAGFSWLLSSLGVFLRDISQITGILVSMLMFLSPIFYPSSAVPATVQPFFYLNPLVLLIEDVRGAIMWGESPAWTNLALMYSSATLCAALGLWWFQKTKKGFADVL